MAKEDTLTCKECKRTCCDDQEIRLRKGQKDIEPGELKIGGRDIDPDKLKAGDWLTTHGITWVKKEEWQVEVQGLRREKEALQNLEIQAPPLPDLFLPVGKEEGAKAAGELPAGGGEKNL